MAKETPAVEESTPVESQEIPTPHGESEVDDKTDWKGLSTSQNVTAPKPLSSTAPSFSSLSTSQNVTAPKHALKLQAEALSLSTSQNVTAPKRF